MTLICPCGSGKSYSICCALLHNAVEQPPCTPEALMRSRFSAFYLGKVDYLVATQLPSQRQEDEKEKIRHALDTHQWRSLRVLACTSLNNAHATVEFVAFCTTPNNRLGQLHEQSNFRFEDRRWWYVDGDMLPDIKLGRNDICWCGSGQKLKKCHP